MKSHVTTIPRSVPTDIRHTYTTIFTNMFNAFQYPLWTNYFTTYCTSDVLFVESSPKSMRPNFPRYIEIIGARLSSQFMYNRLQILPDAVFKIKKTKLFTRSDTSESLVVSSFTIQGTKLYDLNLEPLLPPSLQLREGVVKQECVGGQDNGHCFKRDESENYNYGHNSQSNRSDYVDVNSGNIFKNIFNLRKSNSHSSLNDTDQQPDAIAAADEALIMSYADYIDRAPLLDRPMEVTVTGTLTMHLDVNKRIRKFELVTANKVLQTKHLSPDI